ncbi:hypothetical protein BRC83_06620 [Halobacteriales archaeon QS_1_68_17]|nr:MAG: hypothetical protein BRC83_06620 [Halobacteriales archaeon QS_1_68_17]
MDRISALRNVEEALSAFEAGEIDLGTLERRVRGTLRTYATEFDDPDRSAYRATGDGPADGVVVVAPSAAAARERVDDLVADPGDFSVERLD